MGELFPICRSISGNGLRRILARLGDLIALTTHEVATGTQIFDWTVPKEWNIRDAYITDSAGRRVHGDIAMAVRAMKAGAVDFLAKPFSGQDLLDAVFTALGRDRARRAQEESLSTLRERFGSLSVARRKCSPTSPRVA